MEFDFRVTADVDLDEVDEKKLSRVETAVQNILEDILNGTNPDALTVEGEEYEVLDWSVM